MTKELAQTLAPLIATRAPYAVFAAEDGTMWFCASCGRSAPKVTSPTTDIVITHKEDCRERAHARAVAALQAEIRQALAE